MEKGGKKGREREWREGEREGRKEGRRRRRRGREWREGEREGRREGRRRRRRRGSKKVEHFEHLVLFGSEYVCVWGGSGYGCDVSVCISTCMYACVRLSVCLCGCVLYTNIPHDALKNNIRNLVREAFKIRGAKYFIVYRHGKAHWSLEPASSTACVSVSKSKLVERTEYLIDNVCTSRMQASGERSPALHRRPRTCKPNH